MLPPASSAGRSNASNGSGVFVSNTATIASLTKFITEFRENEAFVYRDRLRSNLLAKEWTLEVELAHLIGYDEELAARCRTEPTEFIPLVYSNSCLPE